MIEALLTALILIAIICLVARLITQLVPSLPTPVLNVIWAGVGIVCLLILLAAVTGELRPLNFPG